MQVEAVHNKVGDKVIKVTHRKKVDKMTLQLKNSSQ